MVNAIAHIDIKPPWLTKQGFVAGAAAAIPVAGGLALAIRLRLHNHAPQQVAIGLAFQQQAPMRSGATTSAGRAKKDWGTLGGAGRAWWLWGWLCGDVLRAADGAWQMGYE